MAQPPRLPPWVLASAPRLSHASIALIPPRLNSRAAAPGRRIDRVRTEEGLMDLSAECLRRTRSTFLLE